MKIQVDSSRMAKACSLAYKNIPGKATIPIIENLHIVADADMLHVSSTDMETWVVYDVPAEVTFDGTASGFCINAANITNLLTNIPSQPITIELHERKGSNPAACYAVIKHSCGTSELPTASADEFPTLRPIEGENRSVPVDVLRRSFQACSFALYGDAEAKPEMASVLLDFKGSSMVAVATDGFRLVRLEHPDIEGSPAKYLISRKPLALLKPALEEQAKDKDAVDIVLIRKDENNVCVQMPSATIYFRQTERRYPNYDSVLPCKYIMNLQGVMSRNDLIAAIGRALLFSDPSSMKLIFRFDGTKEHVVVCGQCIDFSLSSEEKVRCEFTDGKLLTIAIKGTFLKEILMHMASEMVRFYFIDETRQVLVCEENGNPDLTMMIMPMLID